jgi:hypothetical protein
MTDRPRLREVVNVDTVIDGPAAIPARPAVEVAAARLDLSAAVFWPGPKHDCEIRLAGRPIALQLNQDVGHLMGVAHKPFLMKLAHEIDELSATSIEHVLVASSAIRVPDVHGKVAVNAIHCPAIAVDELGDLLLGQQLFEPLVSHVVLPVLTVLESKPAKIEQAV